MKTMNFMKGMAFAAMMVMSMNMMAQRTNNNSVAQRGSGLVVTENGIGRAGDKVTAQPQQVRGREMNNYNDRRDERTYDNRDMRRDDRGFDNRDMHRDDRHFDNRDMRHDNHGYVEVYGGRGHVIPPHYADRVRHMDDGRWGYLRGDRWYYYDTYFEPDYYYSHSVRHFRHHCVADAVGKAAVATVAIAGLISLLVH